MYESESLIFRYTVDQNKMEEKIFDVDIDINNLKFQLEFNQLQEDVINYKLADVKNRIQRLESGSN